MYGVVFFFIVFEFFVVVSHYSSIGTKRCSCVIENLNADREVSGLLECPFLFCHIANNMRLNFVLRSARLVRF